MAHRCRHFLDIARSLRDCAALLAGGITFAAPAAAQTTVTEDFKLLATDGTAYDYFGRSVAIDGDVAIIGAYLDDEQGHASGSAYVFRYNGASWTQEVKLTASDGAPYDYFGYSVAISGNTAIIGAYEDDDRGAESGSAYIFRYDGVSWIQEAKLTASDGASTDYFGWSVSISGNAAVIGAHHRFVDNSRGPGAAYVFRRDGTAWTEEAKLTASDGTSGDFFGWSASISGDTAVIGAPEDDNGLRSAGSAYVFRRDGTVWSQEAKLTASDGAIADVFGFSVAVSGDAAIIAAVYDDDAGDNSGSAYIFRRNGRMWSQETKVTASDAAPGDYFGRSVSICGDIAAVGAYGDDDAGEWTGSAYIFRFNGVSWSEQAKLVASDGTSGDSAGWSVAVCGSAVIGAPWDDDSGNASGSAYIFNLATDWDRDGLADADEINLYGTDPLKADSDLDGANDYAEVIDSHCLDPWNPDSDDDALVDGAEIEAGTNPCDPDTDRDGVWDSVDDMPLVPGVSSGQLEEMTRTLGDIIQLTGLVAFNGPNDNANKGRRNALANRAVSAANAIAAGDSFAAAEALESLIAKVDGVEPEPDWMHDSPEKEQLETDATLLLALLTM